MLFDDAWAHGCADAVSSFGITKQAGVADMAKQILVGQPSRYMSELRSGKLFSRKGLLAETLDPRVQSGPTWLRGPATALNAGLLYGLPLYSLYNALQTPPEHRGSAAGATLGSLIGGTLGAPLGIAGNMAGNLLGSALGESVGRVFNSSKRPERVPSSVGSE